MSAGNLSSYRCSQRRTVPVFRFKHSDTLLRLLDPRDGGTAFLKMSVTIYQETRNFLACQNLLHIAVRNLNLARKCLLFLTKASDCFASLCVIRTTQQDTQYVVWQVV